MSREEVVARLTEVEEWRAKKRPGLQTDLRGSEGTEGEKRADTMPLAGDQEELQKDEDGTGEKDEDHRDKDESRKDDEDERSDDENDKKNEDAEEAAPMKKELRQVSILTPLFVVMLIQPGTGTQSGGLVGF